MKGFLLSLALVQCITTAAAQDIVGKGKVDGKRVVLLSDGSWRYDSSVGTVCSVVAKLAEFCANPKDWYSFATADTVIGESYTFRHDAETYGYLNVWKSGPRPEALTPQTKARLVLEGKPEYLSPVDLEKRFLAVAKRRLGYEPLIIAREASRIAGKDCTLIVLDAKPAEAITFCVADDLSIVASTTARSTLFTQEHRALHEGFLAAISLKAG